MPEPVPRHVRLRAVGSQPPNSLLRPGPPGNQALLLFLGWNAVCVCLRNKGSAATPRNFRQTDESLIPEYLAFGYTSTDGTLFSGIRQLMPGHHLTLVLRSQTTPDDQTLLGSSRTARGREKRSDEEWIKECRRRLEETVRMRLMSDVPLGMFLSGGVDSSAIAALMKRMVTGPVKSFSVGYSEAEYSDSLMRERSPRASERNITKSSSAWMTSSTRFRISSGTKTSRLPGPPASP